ncbi:MAG: hypothetical protein IPJ77_17035 [Planctomycetes bacterium]|nr:hypothetical protein [Planctomycetota bacterium]
MEGTNPAGEAKRARVLRATWMAILLGLALELVIATAANLQGTAWEPVRGFASAAQRVSWSVLLCALLAWAQTLHPPSALRSGLAGLLGAPIAAIAARAVHKGVLQAASAAPATSAGVPWSLIAVRALEYLLLGFLSARLASRGARAHLGLGLAVGGLGLSMQLLLTAAESTLPGIGGLFLLATNELLFPAGCAMVLYAAGAKQRRAPAASPA